MILKQLFIGIVATVFCIPIQTYAITQNSFKLIQVDTQLYNDRVLDQITKYNIDRNLDEMIQLYIDERRGLIPSHLNLMQLEAVFDRSRLGSVKRFDRIAHVLRKEFGKYYTKHRQGGLGHRAQRTLEKLEFETTQWIMDFLITNTAYDHDGVALKDLKVESLYRLFLGKQTVYSKPRMHVCSSISEAALILGVGEFGMRPDSLLVHNVFEDYKGNKYPDSNGIGHAALGFESITKKRYMFDQSSRPLKTPHRLISPGETLEQVIEEQSVRVQLNQLKALYKKITLQKNNRNAAESVQQLEDLEWRIVQILESPAINRHEDLSKNAVNFYEILNHSSQRGKIVVLVRKAFDEMNQGSQKASAAFKRKQWQEAERLYSLLAQYSTAQIELLTPELAGIEGLQDGNGNSVNGEDILDNFQQSVDVFLKNIKAAGNNYRVEIERKEFAEYKKYESRFNYFGETISSSEISAAINTLRFLKDDVIDKINSPTLQAKTRGYYRDLNSAIYKLLQRLVEFSKRI